MSTASIKKIIPCKKDQLINMVLDIEKYPEFVPWCLGGKIYEKKETKDIIEIKADLKVGKRFLNETYTSLVHYHKSIDKIIVSNFSQYFDLFPKWGWHSPLLFGYLYGYLPLYHLF